MKERNIFYELRSRNWGSWLREHRYGLVLLYLPLYLSVFGFLELYPHGEFHLIDFPLDRLIPTIPVFFIPYALWWLLFPGSIAYFYLFGEKRDFLKLCFILFTGYTVCLLTYFIYPNGISIREPLLGRDVFSLAIGLLRSVDISQNVCPSMHVSSTVAIFFTVKDAKDVPKAWKWRVSILSLLIILSTVFIKQHSLVDVFFGILLSYLLYLIWKLEISSKIS